MGDTIWVDVEAREPGNIPADNSIVLRLEKQLEILSAKLNVSKLSNFYAYERGWFTKRRWLDPALALASVSAMHTHLERYPDDLGFEPTRSRQHWPELLMKELSQIRSTLEAAVVNGKKFRFLIVA